MHVTEHGLMEYTAQAVLMGSKQQSYVSKLAPKVSLHIIFDGVVALHTCLKRLLMVK